MLCVCCSLPADVEEASHMVFLIKCTATFYHCTPVRLSELCFHKSGLICVCLLANRQIIIRFVSLCLYYYKYQAAINCCLFDAQIQNSHPSSSSKRNLTFHEKLCSIFIPAATSVSCPDS